jgi:hypothetical protein
MNTAIPIVLLIAVVGFVVARPGGLPVLVSDPTNLPAFSAGELTSGDHSLLAVAPWRRLLRTHDHPPDVGDLLRPPTVPDGPAAGVPTPRLSSHILAGVS